MSKTLTLAITSPWMRRLARIFRIVFAKTEKKIQIHDLEDTERAKGLIWAVCDSNRVLVIIVLQASNDRYHTHIHWHTKIYTMDDQWDILRSKPSPQAFAHLLEEADIDLDIHVVLSLSCFSVRFSLDTSLSSSLSWWSHSVCAWTWRLHTVGNMMQKHDRSKMLRKNGREESKSHCEFGMKILGVSFIPFTSC